MDDKSIQIPGWKIVRTIGQGGFGKVYEVEKDDEFGGVAHSALKVISIPESADALEQYREDGYDDAALTKLLRDRVEGLTAEFRLMSRLKGCSNIVSYEDHTVVRHRDDPGYDVLIRMELLTPLPKYLERHEGLKCSEATVKKLGLDMCGALERCARHSIIHRDIKPQNIFINEDGDFKLGDFGIAKTSEHLMRATKTGTYNYMAPEVYLGKPYHAQVDIYSLGMVLYWMLNERRGPFIPLPPAVPGAADFEDALSRRMNGEMLPPPKNGSAELIRIVRKACAFAPERRYKDATALKQDLERLTVSEEKNPETSAVIKPRRTLNASGFMRADPSTLSGSGSVPSRGESVTGGGPAGGKSGAERTGGFGKMINRSVTDKPADTTGRERSGGFGKLINRSVTAAKPEEAAPARASFGKFTNRSVSGPSDGRAAKAVTPAGSGRKPEKNADRDDRTVALSDAVERELKGTEPEQEHKRIEEDDATIAMMPDGGRKR